MTREEIYEAIKEYIRVVRDEFSSDERVKALSLSLDKLALSTHFCEFVFDETPYPGAPDRDYNALREIVSKNFPDHGYYNVAMHISEKIAESEIVVGDAIDDICDIALDLEEVLWRWRNNSPDDALWTFMNLYGFHWGKHLRDLQLYLYAQEREW